MLIGDSSRTQTKSGEPMKTRTMALASTLALCALAAEATDIGVSVSINQPGAYGRIDIGNAPPPVVIYPQPVVITQPAVVVRHQPVYMKVPRGHEKNWRKHCHRYDACGVPVYFVKYDEPRRHGDRDRKHHHRHDHDHDHDHGHRHGHKHPD
jgi:hypothetical protein